MHRTITLLLLSLAPTALAAPRIDAQSIIVNPSHGEFRVETFVNKDRTGLRNPLYTIGEKISVSVRVNRDAYVYLFNVTSNGRIDLFLPNKYEAGNFVRANTTKTFAPQNGKYQLNVGGPAGQDKLLALASRRELSLNDIVRFVGDQGFATVRVQGQDGLARALSIVVNEIEPGDWTTDTAFFRVAARGSNTGNTGNSGNSGNTGNTGNAGNSGNTGNTGNAGNSGNTGGNTGEVTPVTTIAVGERRDGTFDTAVQEGYERTRGPESLGTPTTYVERWGDGAWQKFEGVASYGDGVLLHADGSSRSFAVHGAILTRYLALAEAESGGTRPPRLLGWAAGDEKIIPRNSFGTSGLYGFFQRGAIYSTERHGTFVLTGELLRVYQGLGGSGSFLGFPLRDQRTESNGRDSAEFEGGFIRWDGATYRVVRR